MHRWDVDNLLAEMTSVQLQEWMEFYHLEPFGPRQEELRFALHTMATLAVSERGLNIPKLEEISPTLGDGKKKPRKSRDLEKKLEGLARATGGEVLDG